MAKRVSIWIEQVNFERIMMLMYWAEEVNGTTRNTEF